MDESGKIASSPDLNIMRQDLYAVSVTDNETREIIAEAYRRYNLLLEPHGATAWKGIQEYSSQKNLPGKLLYISLETAHPAKFPEELIKILKIAPSLPVSLTGIDRKEENYFSLENSYDSLKEFILKH